MVEFIAEVSSNHNNDLNRCFDFIETAAKIGCSGVKFQLFKIDQLFDRKALECFEELRNRKKWELSEKYIPKIAKCCADNNIKFICTPFYLDAVDILEPYVNAYKIASYEILWQDLLSKCAKTKKPMIISTGMATLDEVKFAVETVFDNQCTDLTVLHCTSNYPTLPQDCNLSAIQTMRESLPKNIKFGWSDHSVNFGVIHRAIHKYDVSMVEFHMDLDGKGKEYQMGHCYLPNQVESLIKSVKDAFLADGDGKKEPQDSEFKERLWRADPIDGLRPLRGIRDSLCKRQ
ncbi:N-acetylneuraminate synthase family protein [Desulfurella sp.]|uniref:N-acetylneuraminate synthase family protein n=1 Tax=Desulfurella sp. TaxID=1962857 RepID=UPI003D104961